MQHITRLLLHLLTSVLAATGSSTPPPPPPLQPPIPPQLTTACTEELVSMSPCLSYISAPPNDLVPFPTKQCCDIFASYGLANRGGGASCLCHFVRDPMLLGFPINTTKVVSLFSVCGSPLDGTGAMAAGFRSLCQVTESLPPLSMPAAANTTAASGGGGVLAPAAEINPSSEDYTTGPSMTAPPSPTGNAAKPEAVPSLAGGMLSFSWCTGLPLGLLTGLMSLLQNWL